MSLHQHIFFKNIFNKELKQDHFDFSFLPSLMYISHNWRDQV
jgi:hypothetical protein